MKDTTEITEEANVLAYALTIPTSTSGSPSRPMLLPTPQQPQNPTTEPYRLFLRERMHLETVTNARTGRELLVIVLDLQGLTTQATRDTLARFHAVEPALAITTRVRFLTNDSGGGGGGMMGYHSSTSPAMGSSSGLLTPTPVTSVVPRGNMAMMSGGGTTPPTFGAPSGGSPSFTDYVADMLMERYEEWRVRKDNHSCYVDLFMPGSRYAAQDGIPSLFLGGGPEADAAITRIVRRIPACYTCINVCLLLFTIALFISYSFQQGSGDYYGDGFV